MPDSPSRLSTFLSELKRRRVYRVAAVYAGVAFIICQIVDATFESMGIPIWGERFVFILLAIGFPIAIGMAWAFDLTEEGLIKTKPKRLAAEAKAPHPIFGNKSLAVIAMLAIIVAVWALLREPSPSGTPFIAVLPFDNLSESQEYEAFSDAITDEIIMYLQKIGGLRVISRTSVMQYKGQPKNIRQIGEELGVGFILEGQVQRDRDQVRIRSQLIDARTDENIWSEYYDRDFADIFAIQSDVSQKIATALKVALTPEEVDYIEQKPTDNLEAYDLYLKGWHFRTLETAESMPLAVKYLEQAVALDSTYAQAWAALSPSYNMVASISGWDWDSTRNLRREALVKALELDPNNVLALSEQGVMQSNDYSTARAAFRRALTLDPGNVDARYEYGMFLVRWGHPNEALAELLLAQELDPVNPLPPYGLAMVYNYIRKYDKALEYAQAALELAPDHAGALFIVKWTEVGILVERSRFAEAAAVAARAYAEATSFRYYYRWLLLWAEGALGNRERLYAIRDSLINAGNFPQQEQQNPYQYAHLYATMGEKEQALDLLDIAYESASIGRDEVLYSLGFDFLRGEPRFKALLQKIGLPEVFDENGQLIQPLDETLEAYNAPGSR